MYLVPMTIIKSRPATLACVVPNAPKRCSACRKRVGIHFVALYNGHPELPETVKLAGWKCKHCQAVHELC